MSRLPVRNTCRGCGSTLDAATHPVDDAARPVPGSLSMCGYCGDLTVFADDLSLREPTDAELAGLDLGEIQRASRIVNAFRAARQRS